MNQRPAACLFDLDGLLLDTEPLHGRAWFEAARHFGGRLSDEQLLQLKGRRRQDCADQVVAWLSDSVSADDLLAIQQPIVRCLLPQARPMPSARELVEYCAANDIPMALVTSSSSEAVAFKAEPHPWLQLIQHRIYGDDAELKAGKPDPAPFRLGARRLGVRPETCWAMEDSRAGVVSAQAAGCRVWRLDSSGDNRIFGGDITRVSSLEEVLNALINTSG